MGWNTNVIVARDRTVEQVLALVPDLYTPTERAVDFEAAASPRLAPHLAIAQTTRTDATGSTTNVVMFDPLGRLAENYDGWLNRLSRVHPVFVLSLAAVESRYAFTLFDFTKERCRRRWVGKDLVDSVGDHPSLEPEPTMPRWGCDETLLFALAERMFGPSLAEVSAASYRRVDFG